ncbi:unnamed protein product, partial [Thelazia callipaeda]|uniref:TSC22 domain family protein 1 n=1 Tax=Thelazia callipaeda TaxID=103827 RepID=A0A0N5D924_THECL
TVYFYFSTPASGSVIGGSGTGVNAPVVAIDSKIEQAMDLVKTHLMFAVREEVEALRARIMELESTIIRLETENTILREHIPVDMLKKLSMQGTTNSISTAAAAAI